MKKRLLPLILALLLALPGCAPGEPAGPSPTPAGDPPQTPASPTLDPTQPPGSPTPQPEVTLAFLGTSADLRCAPIYEDLETFCGEKGWNYIEYDCFGQPLSQKGQAEDLVRTERADIALLYGAGNQEELDETVKILGKSGIKVMVFGRGTGTAASRLTVCQLMENEADIQEKAVEFFKKAKKSADSGYLLMTTEPGTPREAQFLDRFAQEELTVFGTEYTWFGWELGEERVKAQLSDHPEITGILCLHTSAAQGAISALKETESLGKVAVLTTDLTQTTLQELEEGTLSALAASDLARARQKLPELLEEISRGNRPGVVYMETKLYTSQNLEELTGG